MTRWRLACLECGREWFLEASYDLSEMRKLYHYCKFCRRNTFHDILGKED
ncbi:MAG: hypothetical protein P3X22_000370 [Thermoprotei archaeon]|nr:hypothetical protein [Thermoprotei archaeon]